MNTFMVTTGYEIDFLYYIQLFLLNNTYHSYYYSSIRRSNKYARLNAFKRIFSYFLAFRKRNGDIIL